MTNINCAEKCIYQKDGKCAFENICHKQITSHHTCAYFVPQVQKTKLAKH